MEIEQFDKYNKYKVIRVFKDGDRVVCYTISAGVGQKNVYPDEAFELAKRGIITNVRAEEIDGNQILTGIDVAISDLPTQQLDGSNEETRHMRIVSDAVPRCNPLKLINDEIACTSSGPHMNALKILCRKVGKRVESGEGADLSELNTLLEELGRDVSLGQLSTALQSLIEFTEITASTVGLRNKLSDSIREVNLNSASSVVRLAQCKLGDIEEVDHKNKALAKRNPESVLVNPLLEEYRDTIKVFSVASDGALTHLPSDRVCESVINFSAALLADTCSIRLKLIEKNSQY